MRRVVRMVVAATWLGVAGCAGMTRQVTAGVDDYEPKLAGRHWKLGEEGVELNGNAAPAASGAAR